MLLPMVSVLFMTIFPVSRTGPSPPTPRKSSNYLREKRQEYLHEGVKYLELNCLQVMPPYFANKGLSGQSYGFPSGHVWMWELDYKESWALKNWCFWTVVLEKTLESPMDCKEIKLVHPKGNQSWIFIGKTDVEAETPILSPPDAKSWLIKKDPDAGKDWR